MKKHYLIALSILFVLLIIGTFFDQKIATTLFNNEQYLSKALAVIAELPFFAFAAICGSFAAIYFKNRGAADGFLGYIWMLFWQAAAIAAWSGLLLLFFENGTEQGLFNIVIEGLTQLIIVGIIATILSLLTSFIVNTKFSKLNLRRQKQIAIYAMLVVAMFIFINLFAAIAKDIWNRPRPVVVMAGGTFYPWYSIAPSVSGDDLYRSFFSAHTLNAFALVVIGSFPFYEKTDKIKFFYLGLLFGFVVAYSRITIGQHFLTDVAFAGIVAVGCAFIVDRIYKKILRKIK